MSQGSQDIRLRWDAPRSRTPDADVIVVGAGPAGCAAARQLAPGHRVLLLDKALFPRPKLCGGCLSLKSVRALEAVFGARVLRRLQPDAYDRGRLYWRGDLRGEPRSPEPCLRFISRSRLDRELLEQAIRAGATTSLGEAVLRVAPHSGEVTTGSRVLRAPVVIAADGGRSVCARSAGLPRPLTGFGAAVTLEAIQPLPEGVRRRILGEPEAPALHFGILPWGYGWVFPRGEEVVIGLGGAAWRNRGIRASFGAFLELLGVRDHIEESKVRGIPLAFGSALTRPFKGRVLLVGEAAGFVDPILGEGIHLAIRSGALAAEAVHSHSRREDPGEIGAAYAASCRREILPEIRWGRRLRKLIYPSPLVSLWFRHLAGRPAWGQRLFQVLSGEARYQDFPAWLLRRFRGRG